MTIDRPTPGFQGPAEERPGMFGRAWGGVKNWSAENPRLSKVVWFLIAVALVVLLVWAVYPKPAARKGGPINNGAHPVGVAQAINGDINVTLNALGTVTPL